MISNRARRWGSADPYLVKAHRVCVRDLYDTEKNPDGYVNFGTAENHLVFDALAPLLRDAVEIREEDAHYNEQYGAQFFREAVTGFLSRNAGRLLSPDNLALSTGASAILEIASFVLADPGDAILIPTPYYPGFDHDLGLRSDARLAHIPLHGPEFRLTVADVENAYRQARSEGMNVTTIVLNSPHNPLGHIYGEDLIRGIVGFASSNGVHVVLDEIYAESLLPGEKHFTGLRMESPFVHVIYGFAKDFGLSGYKVGILHSENQQVLKVVRDFTYFHTISMMTQRALAGVLESDRLDDFLTLLRKRLAAAHSHTKGELSASGVPVVSSQGGIVLWIDLRSRLRSSSFEDERVLCEEILRRCKVSISAGGAFHCSEPGWYRLCFTAPELHRVEGLRRLREFFLSGGP